MAPDLKRKLDYSDLLAAPDDGKRYELVDHCHGLSIGEVFDAPIDLILTNHDVLVPDLLVVSEPKHITKRGIEGPPLLIVEILSPSTQKQDRGVKARRYAELGVEHYWIVDPEKKRVECHRQADGVFRKVVEAAGDTTLIHPDWDELEIDLAALWR